MPDALLVIRAGPRAGSEHPLAGEVVVGRDAGADLVLDDPGISRRHLSVRLEGGAIVAEDLGSSNGTLVNGRPISGAVRLNEGDRIQLGGTVISAHGRGAAPNAPQPAPVPRRLGPSPHEEGNIHALAAIFLGPLSIFLLVFSSGAAFFVSLPTGIAAIVLGTTGIRRADRGDGHRGLARLGRISGIAGTILSLLALIAFVLVVALLDTTADSLDGIVESIREEIEGVEVPDVPDAPDGPDLDAPQVPETPNGRETGGVQPP